MHTGEGCEYGRPLSPTLTFPEPRITLDVVVRSGQKRRHGSGITFPTGFGHYWIVVHMPGKRRIRRGNDSQLGADYLPCILAGDMIQPRRDQR